MCNVRKLVPLVLLVLINMGWFVFAQDFAEVQRKIQDKVPVQDLQVRNDNGKVVLEGRVKLLQDKMDASQVAGKQLKKQEIVNNIEVQSSGRIDQDISVDVIAEIKRRSPQGFVFDDLS